MPDQTWKIIATPKDRWALANFLSHKDLKFKGKKRIELNRFIDALGLDGPNEALHGERKGRHVYASDGRTRHVFTVTAENADFLRECLDSIEIQNWQNVGLRSVSDQLESRKPRGSVEGLPAFSEEIAESEDWAPLTAPILDNPDLYVEVNANLLRQHATYEAYRAAYLKEAEPPAKPEGEAVARPAAAQPS